MKDTTNVKDRIIEVTTAMIEQHAGDTKAITARVIAEKADVGLGLINYHFGSKENLITTCVQRIISNVVTAGVKVNEEYDTDKDHLIAKATHVFNFLFENAAVSRISILGDLQNYSANSNSAYTQRGFMTSLTRDVAEQDKALLSFILTATMQIAFLGSGSIKEILGYDLEIPKERAAYIEKVVTILFEGGKKRCRYEQKN